MKEMICIVCPMGCHLQVDDSNLDDIKVTGNTCLRGPKYAREECTCPKRMVTSVVKVSGGEIAMVSVKTSDSIKKELISHYLNHKPFSSNYYKLLITENLSCVLELVEVYIE